MFISLLFLYYFKIDYKKILRLSEFFPLRKKKKKEFHTNLNYHELHAKYGSPILQL